MDPQLLSEAGGDMLVARIPSSNKIDQHKFQSGMFNNLQAGSLLVVDCVLLENLRDATARAVQDGSFGRCGLVLLIGTRTLVSNDKLPQVPLVLNHGGYQAMSGDIKRADDLLYPPHCRQNLPGDPKAP